MIKYALRCIDGHDFEGWFSTSSDFDTQKQAGFVTCPHCSTSNVEKRLMAPSVATSEKKVPKTADMTAGHVPVEMVAALKQAVKAIRDNCEDVGERFPEEARKMHYGETDARGIMGKATAEDVGSLLEEGIEIMPLPHLPEDAN
ncbi:DUF1178 family protein [Rhizobium sp. L1K21]|uniref:DUF1178 family protein n=1 Tax=Rhizobium sp. L1K21 TaxID=2954933 RepID=UPI0020922E84|nr:DUF1178 family protein [Rhizobium sp. L1K21]MCO6188205.1 DUF1178 family protein [Rhizobium sp. L1K21]